MKEEAKLPEEAYVQRYDMYGTPDSFSRGESGQLFNPDGDVDEDDEYLFLGHHYDLGSPYEDIDSYPTDSLREIAEQLYGMGFRDLMDMDGEANDNDDEDHGTMIVRSPLSRLEWSILAREFKKVLREKANPFGDRQLDLFIPHLRTPRMYAQLKLF